MAYIIGCHQTAFRRDGERTHAELAREAIDGALADAGIQPDAIEATWFGAAALGAFGQATLGGATVLAGAVPAHVPIVEVSAACATGGVALHGAFSAVASSQYDIVVVVGVDRCKMPDPVGLLDDAVIALEQGQHPPTRHARGAFARRQARSVGDDAWAPIEARPILLDISALEARFALRSDQLRRSDFAAVVVKNRANGALNPNAWLRKAVAAEAVAAEPKIVEPFTRSMGCALVDGAAAVVIASEVGMARLSSRARAIRLASVAIGGGSWRNLGEPAALARVASRALSRAGVTLDMVEVAEVHDSNAMAELKWLSAVGLGSLSEVAAMTRSGATSIQGRFPVNPSGGLLSRGHALAATGLAQICELAAQLRGEAGARQVAQPRVALAHNGGGVIGFDDAISAVSILRVG